MVGLARVVAPGLTQRGNRRQTVFFSDENYKALLRKATKPSVDDLWARIGDLLDCFTPDECRNHFEHTGDA